MANIPLYVVTMTRLDAGTLHLEVGFGWPELHATQAVSEALYIRLLCLHKNKVSLL